MDYHYRVTIAISHPGERGTKTFFSTVTDLAGIHTVLDHGNRKEDLTGLKYIITRTLHRRDDENLQEQLDTNW